MPTFPSHDIRILPCRPEHVAQVLLLDREICGEDRASVLREKMATSYVFLSEDLVQGCFFPNLGGGVIEAATPRAGLELIRFKAMASTSATVLRESAVAIEYLRAHGFRETSRRPRMVLGEPLRWKPDCVYGL